MLGMLRDMDPRHSLIAAIIWLVVALAASFAVAASLWAGNVARDIVVQQHVRRLPESRHSPRWCNGPPGRHGWVRRRKGVVPQTDGVENKRSQARPAPSIIEGRP